MGETRRSRARANAEWRRWGDQDPLYGVASWENRRAGDPGAWTEEEFYALGDRDWADFRARWRQFGLTPGTCVEIGCGAGRMTRAIARDFEHVHAIDVSPGMLARATEACAGLPVSFHETDGLGLPLAADSVDAAFSTHVFQHFDSLDDAVSNFREIARVLRPGGTLMVHLPVHLWPGGLEGLQLVYDLRRRLGDVRARVQRRRMERDPSAPGIMRGQCYRWESLEEELRALGFSDVQLTVFRVRSNDGPHSCVLARLG